MYVMVCVPISQPSFKKVWIRWHCYDNPFRLSDSDTDNVWPSVFQKRQTGRNLISGNLHKLSIVEICSNKLAAIHNVEVVILVICIPAISIHFRFFSHTDEMIFFLKCVIWTLFEQDNSLHFIYNDWFCEDAPLKTGKKAAFGNYVY